MKTGKTFLRGGIRFEEDRKDSTAGKPMERFLPRQVVLPLLQHAGVAAQAVVKRKDKVRRGDRIGLGDKQGAPVHASVSGTVSRVALMPHPVLTESLAVVIERDPAVEEPAWEEDPRWKDQPRDILLERIEAAGVVGLGGAAFPTHRKLRLPPGVAVDTLILNGAECEPYLTADERLMIEHPAEVLEGARLLAKIVGAEKILIGIEENKPMAIAAIAEAMRKDDSPPPISIEGCHACYPQGSERQLIEALTGRVVPPRKLPFHVGVVVQNVATAMACYEAIRFGKPLLDRGVTISGRGIANPKNLLVPIGTLVEEIVQHLGGFSEKTVKVVAGGPMMGRALGRLDLPVIKGTAGILFLTPEEWVNENFGPCISCARCLEVCPLGLEPNQISIYTEALRMLETEPFGTKDCFECGCCAFVCPSRRPLVQFIQIAKRAFNP